MPESAYLPPYPLLDIKYDIAPNCATVFSTGGANFDLNRQALINILNSFIKPSSSSAPSAAFFNDVTPLGRAYDSAGKYFSNHAQSLCSAGFCARNFLAVISDGIPNTFPGETTLQYALYRGQ